MTAADDVVARAQQAGVMPAYQAAGGRGVVHTSHRTAAALLGALGASRAPSRRRSGDAPTCVGVEERLGARRGVGLWLNTYTLRGEAGRGIGTFAELSRVIDWAGAIGLDFVGISPLHLLRNVPPDISPYSPSSRLWRNPLYLDLAAMPESRAPDVKACWSDPEIARERERLEGTASVDYAACQSLLRRMARAAYTRFAADCEARPDSERARAHADFVKTHGRELRDLATFQAIEEHGAARGWPRDFRQWPAELRSPDSPAVQAFQREHADDVAFECFLQHEIDRQLGELGARASRAGLAIGLYNDLAIGSSSSGFDAWAHTDLVVPSVTVGAPPDDYAEQGQDWGFPPLHPHRIANGSSYFSRLIDAGLAHMGALRIDHVMGLFRQFWIPAGMTGKEGAYVRFPATVLLDTIAEVSRRRGGLVVGEDLGTVPRTLPPVLARRNILSYRVLLFERERGGGFKAAARYSSRALVTATTHDHPTLLGYARGGDLEIQRSLGRIPDDAALAAAKARRDRELSALGARIAGDAPAGGGGKGRAGRPTAWSTEGAGGADDPAALCLGVYRFLARTPSPLLAVSLDDLAGELLPVNVPGESVDSYPCWSRRMTRTVGEITGDARIAETVRAVIAERRAPAS